MTSPLTLTMGPPSRPLDASVASPAWVNSMKPDGPPDAETVPLMVIPLAAVTPSVPPVATTPSAWKAPVVKIFAAPAERTAPPVCENDPDAGFDPAKPATPLPAPTDSAPPAETRPALSARPPRLILPTASAVPPPSVSSPDTVRLRLAPI